LQQTGENDITKKTKEESSGEIVVFNKGKRYNKENKEQGSGSWVIICDFPL
jgi:hypothetical protein